MINSRNKTSVRFAKVKASEEKTGKLRIKFSVAETFSWINTNMKSLHCFINTSVTKHPWKRLIIDFYRFLLEHGRAETYLLWKAFERHGRFKGRFAGVRRTRSAHSSSRFHTKIRTWPIEIRESKHTTIIQQHQSKYYRHEHQWIAATTHTCNGGGTNNNCSKPRTTTATTATKCDEHSQ